MLSLMAEQKGLLNKFIRKIGGDGPPTDAITGAGDLGPGSEYIDFTNSVVYRNTGTKTTPIWSPELMRAVGTISSADIVATGAGKFGHAAGVPLFTVPATKMVELISGILIYDFLTAAYGAGGNTTINLTGGAAVTGLVSNANFAGAAVDKTVVMYPLATAGVAVAPAIGLSLVTSAAFTQPGTAAGVIRYVVNYRLHTTGL